MELITKAERVFDIILGLMLIIIGALIVFMMLAVGADVVLRSFFRAPLKWVFDVTEIILLYITFLGAAWVLKKEGHVKIDLIVNQLNPRIQALLGIASSIIGLFICWVLVWYGVQVTQGQFQRGIYEATALETPTGVIILAIPIGGFLLFIQFLRRGYGYLRRWKQLGIGPKGVE